MRRILGLIWLIILTTVLGGHSQSNPFDLKYRSAAPKYTPVTPDLDEAVDTVKVIQTQVIPQEPVADTASAEPAENEPLAISGNNPFDKKIKSPSKAGKTKKDEVKPSAPVKIEVEKPKDNSAPPHTSKGLLIFFLLFSLLLLIFIVNVERSFVHDLWRVISNENYSSLHHRNQRNTMRQILLMMGYLVFVIQGGVFLFHILRVFGYRKPILDNVWTCMALVTAVYLVRHTVIKYLRWLFNNDKEMTLFGFDVSIFNIMVGLVLLPVNVLIIFGPENFAKPLIYIGIIVALVAYLMRQLRWMLTARQLITNSLFLFFVYLCAVEILPLWAISKFFW